MSEKVYAYYDVYGCRFRVYGPESLIGRFDANYKPFRVGQLDASVIAIDVVPYSGDELLPIFVKGGEHGLSFKAKRASDGSEVVEVFYNQGVVGAEQRLVVDFTRFLLFWGDKCQAHAAAVSKDGDAFVFLAPGNTGKTTTALQMVSRGYSLIGDDWVILDDTGGAFAYPQPIRIHDYNLAYNLTWCKKMYGVMGWPVHMLMRTRVSFRNKMIPKLPSRAMRYVAEWALTRPIREVPVDSVAHNVASAATVRRAYWLERVGHEESVQVSEMTLDELIERVVDTFSYEYSESYKWYHSQSQLGNRIGYIDGAMRHLDAVLRKGFSGIPCMKVRIPVGTTPEALYKAISSTF